MHALVGGHGAGAEAAGTVGGAHYATARGGGSTMAVFMAGSRFRDLI